VAHQKAVEKAREAQKDWVSQTAMTEPYLAVTEQDWTDTAALGMTEQYDQRRSYPESRVHQMTVASFTELA
jgi:hypothetical protein